MPCLQVGHFAVGRKRIVVINVLGVEFGDHVGVTKARLLVLGIETTERIVQVFGLGACGEIV